MMDEGKLDEFIGRMLGDLGGTSSIAMVWIGDGSGHYKALQAKGPMTCAELAKDVSVNERCLRGRLSHQAASHDLSYAPMTKKFALAPEQAMVFAIENSPAYMMGGFDLMVALMEDRAKVQAAFKSGGSMAWGEQAGCRLSTASLPN